MFNARDGGKHPFFIFHIFYIRAPEDEQVGKTACKTACKTDLPFPRYHTSKFEVYM